MSQANLPYLAGRKQYQRPQAMIWCDQPPTITEDKLVPIGYEIGIDTSEILPQDLLDNRFLILSDHNRSDLDLSVERIEQKRRMVNGTMRSYHVADKVSISLEWSMLPSRSFKAYPTFNLDNGKPSLITSVEVIDENSNSISNVPVVPYGSKNYDDQKYTVDGGAGGSELLDWYENHTGPFWVMLSYDKIDPSNTSTESRARLSEYTQVMQMYFKSFNYSVVKRGATNADMWNISVTLEEV